MTDIFYETNYLTLVFNGSQVPLLLASILFFCILIYTELTGKSENWPIKTSLFIIFGYAIVVVAQAMFSWQFGSNNNVAYVAASMLVFFILGGGCGIASLRSFVRAALHESKSRELQRPSLMQGVVLEYFPILIEEFVFRVLLNAALSSLIGVLLGVMSSSFLFALMHLRHSCHDRRLILVNGMLFALCLSLTATAISFGAAVTLHLGWNVVGSHIANNNNLRLGDLEASSTASLCYTGLFVGLITFLCLT